MAAEAVCAVVVTFNRVELLRECLTALQAQTRPPDRIVVVDNASTDGTADAVAAEFGDVDLLRLAENVGAAGGFAEGLARAQQAGATHAWMLDDDTIAAPEALSALLDARDRAPEAALLASVVQWSDGALHPMNLPGLRREVDVLVEGVADALLPLRTTTFVSLLVSLDAVAACGPPLAHYFLWSDDIEFTARITRHFGLGFLVPASVVEHRTPTPHTAVSEGGARFYYHVRNSLYMLRSDAWSVAEKLSVVFLLGRSTGQYLRGQRRAGVRHVLEGLRDGLRSPAAAGGRRPTPAPRA